MADLTYIEKRKLEALLEMGSGYVLNFSNRTFEEFVLDTTGHNIFDQRYNYASGSRANRLRAFWQKEDNATVGKLLKTLLELADQKSPHLNECRKIVDRLLGGRNPASQAAQADADSERKARSAKLAELKESFFALATEVDRSKAGLAFEKVLNQIFHIFGLEPRGSFRVTGEQIDGSFLLDGEVYLLEPKWEKAALPEADLLVFRGKIEAKSTFTRGVFIALNDISSPARDAITRGKAPSFFVMNGYDLMMILTEEISLPEFLRKRVRRLAEEGRVCVAYSEL